MNTKSKTSAHYDFCVIGREICVVLRGQQGCVLTVTSRVQSAYSDIQGALCAYDGASLSRATDALLTVPGEHCRPMWLRGQRGYFTFSTERTRTRGAGLLCGRKRYQTNASTCRQQICVKTASHTHNQLILDSGYLR